MREADTTDMRKSQERVPWSEGRGSERKRCDSFVNSLFEEADDAGILDASPDDNTSKADVVIKMWKNGFTINEGQLRDYADIASRTFMDSMRKGELPLELQNTFGKEEVDVNVEDRKTEEYLTCKPHINPFSGLGYRLGSATPKIITLNGIEDEPFPTVALDELEPITNIKIWLADGERIVQKFNTSHRVSDLRDFIKKIPGKSVNIPFTLATFFPLRELLDETITLQEAQLQNSVLVQKLQKMSEPFRNS